jgi:hypothetical protein
MVRTDHNPLDEKPGRMTIVFPIQQIGRDDVYTETLDSELQMTRLRATTANEPPTP